MAEEFEPSLCQNGDMWNDNEHEMTPYYILFLLGVDGSGFGGQGEFSCWLS